MTALGKQLKLLEASMRGREKPRQENSKYFDYFRGRHCVMRAELQLSTELAPVALELFDDPLWIALDLTAPLEKAVDNVQAKLPVSLQKVICGYSVTGRLSVEQTLLLSENEPPSRELLACLLVLIRIGVETHRNDSASDICLLLSDVLLTLGIELLELGIAGPLAGYAEAVIYPYAATQNGSMLSNLGTSFVEACLLLEALVTSRCPGITKNEYPRLARWHLHHGPEEAAGIGLLPSATSANDQFIRDLTAPRADLNCPLRKLKFASLQRLRERFPLAV